nr:interferon-induced helicase C domain-containing protein 1 isoform X1 [Biomphalaria glabrata]
MSKNSLTVANVHLDYLVNEVYRPYIISKVVVKHLMSYMPFMNEILPEIYTLSDSKTSAVLFLDHLKKVDEPGKYQAFKEALGHANYQNIVKALEDEDIRDDFNHKKIMELFHKEIQQKIDPSILAEDLLAEELISQDQFDEIRNLEEKKNTMDAVFLLLDSIPRMKDQWFETFLKILDRNERKELVEILDDTYYSKQGDGAGSQNISDTLTSYQDINHEAGDVNPDLKQPSLAVHQMAEPSGVNSDVFQEIHALRQILEKQQQLLLTLNSKVENIEHLLQRLVSSKGRSEIS